MMAGNGFAKNKDTSRRIRLGMVGGGEGSFIGAAHRIAARLDDEFELVAGALSSTPAKAHASATALRIAPERSYADYGEMARAEATREDGIDAVVIVTPNHLHVPVALAFAEQGIHIICDKPIATSLADAQKLAQVVRERNLHFLLTHTYSGYPMVRQAREMIAAGELGDIRIVQVEYAQDWLGQPIEQQGNKQAAWRNDPAQAGPAGALGDIGTHAYHLARYVSGLKVQELSAELSTFVAGRALDDHVQVMLHYEGGARGMLWASQVASGAVNALRLRVYGTQASLHFDQERPEELRFARQGEPAQCLRRGLAPASSAIAGMSRIPAGHPEGYLEAFAQLYRDFAQAWRKGTDGANGVEGHMPGLDDGIDGMAFVEAAIRSHRDGAKWTKLQAI
ncbi:Gfo/Idh/MocA family protein [Variovorax sp. VNK109]|uniref:Gfo/Idh/MocA family protein n=1 Tax=Variovorax sp. VNK109 TaxID=3400919 RepID=UPI003C1187E5